MEKKTMVMEAIAFAARAHKGQERKDGETPYVSHPMRVCMVLRDVFGVEDKEILAAGVLHDIIEDTTKDFDDIEKKFGFKVASWVATLSKDKRMQEETREEEYFRQLRNGADEVKLIKLADVYDNLIDSENAGSEAFVKKTVSKAELYLENFSGCENENVLGAMGMLRDLMKETELMALVC